MAIKFTDKGDGPEPAEKASAPPRAADAPPVEAPEAEMPLPFAKAVRPEKKRRGK